MFVKLSRLEGPAPPLEAGAAILGVARGQSVDVKHTKVEPSWLIYAQAIR